MERKFLVVQDCHENLLPVCLALVYRFYFDEA